MIKNKLTISIISIALLTGCADQEQRQQVVAGDAQAYIEQVKGYNCKQLGKEKQRISLQQQQLSTTQAQSDVGGLVTAGLTAYMISQRYAFTTGDDVQAANNAQLQYLQIKQQYLDQRIIEKNCD